MFHFLPWWWWWYSDVDRNNFWLIRKPCNPISLPYSVGWTNIHTAIGAIPSSEMARTFSFIYDRFHGNSSADILEESTSDWIRRGKPARKNTYYGSLKCLCQLKLSTQSFAGLITDSRSFKFPPTFACLYICMFIFGSLLSLLRTGPRTFPWSRFIHT